MLIKLMSTGKTSTGKRDQSLSLARNRTDLLNEVGGGTVHISDNRDEKREFGLGSQPNPNPKMVSKSNNREDKRGFGFWGSKEWGSNRREA